MTMRRLRTPLAALKVHAQNAARAPSAAERQASLERMLQGLERTVHLAEQMLAYSRAASPGEAARMETVALGALVTEALEALQPRAAERKVTIRRRGADAAVRGERHKLASLVTNLIDNAVRYGPEGGRVTIEVHRAGGTVLLSGLLDGRYDHVVSAMAPLRLRNVDELDGWVALMLRE